MRGKAAIFRAVCVPMGITPAYAGKSHRDEAKRQGTGDHPRICGEKLIIAAGIVISWGSPPHMRGKATACVVLLNGGGITPAYAGKSRR